MSVHHAYTVPEKGVRSPGTKVTWVVNLLMDPGIKPSSTETLLQSLFDFFFLKQDLTQ